VTADGLEITVANRTKGAVSWSWTFGDGGSSSARTPSHTYAEAGTYTITLVATAGNGATDRATRTVTVGG
jgi:PKD repeat protein